MGRRKRKSAGKSAKQREKKRAKAKKNAESTPIAKKKSKRKPTSAFPATAQASWTRSECLEFFDGEPALHNDLIKAGYKTVRSECGRWYVQSPGKETTPGRIFSPMSARMKTKSIPKHLVAPANVLKEPQFTFATPSPVRACICLYLCSIIILFLLL